MKIVINNPVKAKLVVCDEDRETPPCITLNGKKMEFYFAKEKMSWSKAIDEAAPGWRLPTEEEMLELLYRGEDEIRLLEREAMKTIPEFKKEPSGLQRFILWASDDSDDRYAWSVNFGTREMKRTYRCYSYHILYAREYRPS